MIGKDLKGSSLGLIDVVFRNLPLGTEENHDKAQSGSPVSCPRSEPAYPGFESIALPLTVHPVFVIFRMPMSCCDSELFMIFLNYMFHIYRILLTCYWFTVQFYSLQSDLYIERK
jgi:hypothetical protein